MVTCKSDSSNVTTKSTLWRIVKYIQTHGVLRIVVTIAPAILIFGAFVSVIKPWGRIRQTKEGAELDMVTTKT